MHAKFVAFQKVLNWLMYVYEEITYDGHILIVLLKSTLEICVVELVLPILQRENVYNR